MLRLRVAYHEECHFKFREVNFGRANVEAVRNNYNVWKQKVINDKLNKGELVILEQPSHETLLPFAEPSDKRTEEDYEEVRTCIKEPRTILHIEWPNEKLKTKEPIIAEVADPPTPRRRPWMLVDLRQKEKLKF